MKKLIALSMLACTIFTTSLPVAAQTVNPTEINAVEAGELKFDVNESDVETLKMPRMTRWVSAMYSDGLNICSGVRFPKGEAYDSSYGITGLTNGRVYQSATATIKDGSRTDSATTYGDRLAEASVFNSPSKHSNKNTFYY